MFGLYEYDLNYLSLHLGMGAVVITGGLEACGTGFGNTKSAIARKQDLAFAPFRASVDYGLFYKQVVFVQRRDGFVFQVAGESDYYGFDDDTTTPSQTEAELAINTIASLFAPA